MGSIQVRLSQSQFQKSLLEFLGKQINVVFMNDTTFLGYVTNIEGNTITLQNMRLKKTTHSVTDINEVYFDKKS